jgi:hypothetical protein
MLAALIAAHSVAASLRVGVGDSSEAIVQVVEDRTSGYRLKVDCVSRCSHPLHYAVPIGDTPMGLVDLGRGGLVYSVWGTGCCYMARVWRLTPAGVAKVFESGSRGLPSLITSPSLTVITYMRPTDASGRETSTSPRPLRWTYRHGRFERCFPPVADISRCGQTKQE